MPEKSLQNAVAVDLRLRVKTNGKNLAVVSVDKIDPAVERNSVLYRFLPWRRGHKLRRHYADGTYGSYSTRGAFSFNGVVGVNVARKNSVRFDIAGLIGAREKTTDCPASFLGYACYADRPPDRNYSVNYGGVAAFSYKKLAIGVRVTGASTQGLLGIRF